MEARQHQKITIISGSYLYLNEASKPKKIPAELTAKVGGKLGPSECGQNACTFES